MVSFLLLGCGSALMSSFLCRRAAGLFDSNFNYHSLFLYGFHFVILTSFCIQVWAVVLLLKAEFFAEPSPNTLTGIFMWLSSVTDWSLTVSLFLLLRRRLDGNLSSVRRMLQISVQTASWTSIATLLGAITAVAWPPSNYTTANILVSFQGPLSSLYALSIVVTLASRTERTAVVVGSTHAGIATAEFARTVLHKRGGTTRKDTDDVDYGFDSDEEEADGWNGDGDRDRRGSVGIELGEPWRASADDRLDEMATAAAVAGQARRVSFADVDSV